MAPGLTSVSRPTISLFALPVSAVEFSKQRVRDRLAEEAEDADRYPQGIAVVIAIFAAMIDQYR